MILEVTEKGARRSAEPLLCRGDMTRTCDPLVPNQMRYQLRHTPKSFETAEWKPRAGSQGPRRDRMKGPCLPQGTAKISIFFIFV